MEEWRVKTPGTSRGMKHGPPVMSSSISIQYVYLCSNLETSNILEQMSVSNKIISSTKMHVEIETKPIKLLLFTYRLCKYIFKLLVVFWYFLLLEPRYYIHLHIGYYTKLCSKLRDSLKCPNLLQS